MIRPAPFLAVLLAILIAGTLAISLAYAQQTVFDASGTVTTGGTSQQVLPYNPNRKYLLIENPIAATETLYCNFSAAAATTGSASISLAAGGSYERSAPNFVPKDAIACTATTTGHAFTVKEG